MLLVLKISFRRFLFPKVGLEKKKEEEKKNYFQILTSA